MLAKLFQACQSAAFRDRYDGLTAKLPVAENKRQVDIVLTEQGRKSLEAVSPTHTNVSGVLFGGLDEAAFEALSY